MPSNDEKLHKSIKDTDLIRLLEQIYDYAPHGVICFDNEHKIVMVNQAAQGLLEYRKEELIDSHVRSLYVDTEAFNRMMAKSDTGFSSHPFDETLLSKSGRKAAVEITIARIPDDRGDALYFVKALQNVKDRRTRLNKFRLQRRMFRLMADNSYNWEWWSNAEGRFMYVSPSCERICGYGATEFLENPDLFAEIVLDEDKDIWKSHLDCNTPSAGRRELQFRITRRDGDIRWIEHRCQAVIDEQGILLGFRASNQDITLRKKYEVELHQSLAKIERFQAELEDEQPYEQKYAALTRQHNHVEMIGDSDALHYILFKIDQVADTDTSVLVLGETGTGKGLIVRALHHASRRCKQALITVDCASIPATIIESQLFGHEKGSFTGAIERQIGRFEQADKGTLFLDEIGDLPLELQAKLLRVLQEREFERVGGSKTISADVRILAATNRNLEEDVSRGFFRQDLWYRLNVFPITAPPLRDRPEDIPVLAEHFAEIYARNHHKTAPIIPRKMMTQLQDHSWPGNVRELKNIIERAVINAKGGKLSIVDPLAARQPQLKKHLKTMAEIERNYIIKVLEECNWKVSGTSGTGSAAEILDMKRSTLRARMDKFNIRKP